SREALNRIVPTLLAGAEAQGVDLYASRTQLVQFVEQVLSNLQPAQHINLVYDHQLQTTLMQNDSSAFAGMVDSYGILTNPTQVANTLASAFSSSLVWTNLINASMNGYDAALWSFSNGWSNGAPFQTGWRNDHGSFTNGILNLQLDNQPACATTPLNCSNEPYASAEYQTTKLLSYGKFHFRVKPVAASGVITGLFLYTGAQDNQPHDEVDIEFLGKDTTGVQFNFYTNGVGGHEFWLPLGFDASLAFHDYTIEWLPNIINWYVDGILKHTVNASASVTLPSHPQHVFLNLWAATGVDAWTGPFNYSTPLVSQVDQMTYTPYANVPPVAGLRTAQAALAFNGVDQYATIPPIALAGSSFSIDFWAKRAGSGASDILVSQTVGAVTDQVLRVGWLASDQFTLGFWNDDLTTAAAYPDVGTWHHWAVSYDATTLARVIYRDGQQVAADTSLAAYTGSGSIALGTMLVPTATYAHATLDNLRIWNTARTQAQIQTDRYTTLTGNEANLVGYWNFNDGYGAIAKYSYAIAPNHASLGNGVTANMPQWVSSGAFGAANFALVNVAADQYATLYLGGIDPNGDAMTMVVSSLPAVGSLYQTVDGYTAGAAITNPYTQVTDSYGRVVYGAPAAVIASGSTIDFYANDGLADSSTANIQINLLPMGTTHIWTGATSTAWGVASNWDVGTVPATASNVVVPSGTINQPVLATAVSVADLTISVGGTLNIGVNALTVSGNLIVQGTLAGTGAITMGGTGKFLAGSLPNLIVVGSVSLVGATDTASNLTINGGGTLNLNGQSLTVSGDLSVSANDTKGMLMNNIADVLTVNGNASFFVAGVAQNAVNLTAGVIHFHGNVTAYGTPSFASAGTQKVVFDGSTAQTVTFSGGSSA
ncbi:MAG: family 16 glycosylhydrolase, partial [Mariprofundales bacterium]